MAVGQGTLYSGLSYIAVGRESTFKTYNTCTAVLPFISASIRTTQEDKILEQIETSRTYSKRISMMKKVEGDVEGYFYPMATACVYLLQNALGGAAITSATATGETTGGTAFDHTFVLGNFDETHSSLCLNVRKGDSASAKVFEYNGVRVNELMFTAEIDEALKFNTSIIGVDSTSGGTDVSSALTSTTLNPLSFVGGRVSVANSPGSLTSTSFWHVQSVEFGNNNSLKSDAASGRIGSRVLDVLPPGVAVFTFNLTLRFDTTTAYDAMLSETKLAAEIEFLGPTIPGSSLQERLKVEFPRIYISEAGDPEIGGPDEVLTSEVVCHVLRDDSSAGGYAIRAQVRNNVSGY